MYRRLYAKSKGPHAVGADHEAWFAELDIVMEALGEYTIFLLLPARSWAGVGFW